MIKVDISHVWGQLALPDLLAMEKEVAQAHATLTDGTGSGNDFLGWQNLPTREPTEEILRIQSAARRIRNDSDVFVVIGIGGSYLGPRAAIELLQGPNHNMGKGKGDPQIYFAGNGLSTRHWNELCRLLEGKDFSIAIISKSGTTTEPAIATRALRAKLEEKYGVEGARKRIYAITDPCKGALRQMATEEGWETFVIPANVGGRFSVLTPVGLLPLAVAGVDIMEMMNGAVDAREAYDLRSFDNPVWLYAAVRNLLYRNGKAMEIFESFEPGFKMFGGWWQQLFGESEGKDGKGIFPVTAEFTADLHSLGQMIQQGQRNIFETMVRFDAPTEKMVIGGDEKNLDGLNYLEGRTLDFVDEKAFLGTLAAHVDGGVPVITMDCGELNDRKVGEMFYFLELCCGVSAYILGVNPFNQPGVEFYKRNMFKLLGKPGYEA
ncbi:glucose-6-phosphate isomerase [Pseudoflavonifractor sp. MSJ-30]|uniref:glucose-6-phosphate isomerase n=1 Tax=Pseudoflavonifractor sp. MSJ-30 TaxID=2841525 RepID=UPI001C11E2BD|nr:glucose-6-phosphate isomerase [Pseudoflavonifractor sp. MSJ-30]MBU5452522.1 glucose-6-phosphate isomerase [Pseudoflavonifractor sp. MSJ-30]